MQRRGRLDHRRSGSREAFGWVARKRPADGWQSAGAAMDQWGALERRRCESGSGKNPPDQCTEHMARGPRERDAVRARQRRETLAPRGIKPGAHHFTAITQRNPFKRPDR